MKKEAYYFSHDANARNDVKCIKLRRELGLEGYGIFWALIEILRESPEHKLPLASLEDIAYDLHISKEKIEAVIMRYDLFTLEQDQFFSMRLNRSMSNYYDKKKTLSDAGAKGNAIRWGSGGDRVAIAGQSQLKESIGKKKKGKKLLPPSAESVKQFYDEQLSLAKGREAFLSYKKMVDYLYGQNPLKQEYKNILSVQQQVTYEQFESMREKSIETGVTIKEILDSMENRSNLSSTNLTVSGTAMNWMRRNANSKPNNAA